MKLQAVSPAVLILRFSHWSKRPAATPRWVGRWQMKAAGALQIRRRKARGPLSGPPLNPAPAHTFWTSCGLKVTADCTCAAASSDVEPVANRFETEQLADVLNLEIDLNVPDFDRRHLFGIACANLSHHAPFSPTTPLSSWCLPTREYRLRGRFGRSPRRPAVDAARRRQAAMGNYPPFCRSCSDQWRHRRCGIEIVENTELKCPVYWAFSSGLQKMPGISGKLTFIGT